LLGVSIIAQLACAQTAPAQLQAKVEAPADQAGPAPASSPLTITGVASSATPEAATVSWTTNQPAVSRLDYGTSRDALTMNVTDSRLVTQHSLSMTGLTPGTKYIAQITSANAAGENATQIVGKDDAAHTPAAAPAPAPAPTALATPAMTGPLQALPPAIFDAGPFGKLAVNGVLSGFGMVQGNYVAGDGSKQAALSNGQVIIQKTDGWFQFYVQAGAYTLPSLATPFLATDTTMSNFFGPVPIGYLKLQAAKNTSVLVGALPTLIGAEYDFTFQNMNIERGLLFNLTPTVSRGIQVNQTMGKLTASLSWNDGLYSNRYTWLSGSLTYANGPHAFAFVAGGNYGQTAFQTPATPVLNNSSIYDVIYTFTKGSWIVQPYFQYDHVPTNPNIGVLKGASTTGGAILVNHTFKHGFSLPARLEYVSSSGNASRQSVNLLFGPGSAGTSLTVTPTFQHGGFFIRGDVSWVHASGYTPGFVFGATGTNQNQVRAIAEFGFIFGNNM
jgi:hypothetical protein